MKKYLILVLAIFVSGCSITSDNLDINLPLDQKAVGVLDEVKTETNKDDITKDWNTYTNEMFGYRLKYPKGWIFEEFDEYSYVGFGTPDSKEGGYIWGAYVVASDILEKDISSTGIQFENRVEARENVFNEHGIDFLLVTVTNRNNSNWISKKVYTKHDDLYIVVNNGAVENKLFYNFYNSLESI
jgi:hypothetical protein